MIGIVDYGLGNIRAFENIYRQLGFAAMPVQTAEELVCADRLILPGVGAFDWARSCLEKSGMVGALNQRVIGDGIPILGVCVGMQLMADSSEEGKLPGLGWISGRVERFQDDLSIKRIDLPHMGWNDIEPMENEPIFSGIKAPRYYFLHSFFYRPSNELNAIAWAQYGKTFVAAVRRDNIYGTQFHPEKSHNWGVALLRNFATL